MLAEYEMYSRLSFYFFLDKNLGWVIDESYYEEFREDFQVGDPPVGRPYDWSYQAQLVMVLFLLVADFDICVVINVM